MVAHAREKRTHALYLGGAYALPILPRIVAARLKITKRGTSGGWRPLARPGDSIIIYKLFYMA